MEVFRLSRKKYADGLSGKGSAIRGARWNSRGVEVVYVASSRALAMSEILVHLNSGMIPNDFEMLTIDVPGDISPEEVDLNLLPTGLTSFADLSHTQKIGDGFLNKARNCLLKVPSVVVPGDYNYLMNPHHSDFSKIKVIDQVDFPFDQRFF